MSNYPDGMTRRDLIHVGAIAPDWCENCDCAETGEQQFIHTDPCINHKVDPEYDGDNKGGPTHCTLCKRNVIVTPVSMFVETYEHDPDDDEACEYGGCGWCDCSCHNEDDDGEARYEEMLDREESRRSDPDYGFSAYD